ncbi:MAG: DoxX family protein [Candidatus Obscuribacterales bacterium]|nr:DoxX family protein [Candidatus Obscuribacterales bacterium]
MFDLRENNAPTVGAHSAAEPRSSAEGAYNTRGTMLGLLFGRFFLGGIFLIAALVKICNYESTTDHMLIQGVLYAQFYLNISIVLEMVGAFCLFTGLYSSAAALVLFFYLIPVTVLFHDFWDVQQFEQQFQIMSFLKNTAIMGGLLLAACAGPGAWTIKKARW